MGCSKASLAFGPESLLERVVRTVSPAVRDVIVVAAPEPEQTLPQLSAGVRIVRDPISGQGPLQGIVTGLSALPVTAEFVYITAVDTPFLNPRWIEFLSGVLDAHDIAVPFVASRYHLLSALYRRSRALPAARSLLHAGERRLSFLIDELHCRLVAADALVTIDPGLQTLRNLNTPDEYRNALSEAGLS